MIYCTPKIPRDPSDKNSENECHKARDKLGRAYPKIDDPVERQTNES